MIEFKGFDKIARLSREMIVSEKIDGTNAQVTITGEGEMFAGSRNRFITPDDDNFGFARWVGEHKQDLASLGPGTHFGEWWGSGIGRRYNINEKRFSLFNVSRWGEERPSCCHVVPVLYSGIFDTARIEECIAGLRENGSAASPGFMKPEGVVIFHVASKALFKKTLEKDEKPKGSNEG